MYLFTRITKTAILLIACFGTLVYSASAQDWTTVSTDPDNDGSQMNWADGEKMEYAYNAENDRISIRFTLANLNQSIASDFGINVMVFIEGSSAQTFKFWGTDNKQDDFHYLLTGWVTGAAPSSYTGTIGVANAAGVGSASWTNKHSNNLNFNVKVADGTITVSVPRAHLIPNADLKNGKASFKLAGAVGNSMGWNDDLYDASKTLSIDAQPVGLNQLTASTGITTYVFPNPSADELRISGISKYPTAYSIYNHTGQVVQTGTHQEGQAIDVLNLNAGVYFIKLAKETASLRFIKS